MNPALLSVYHRLPAPMRTTTASIWGFYLRAWRYGPQTQRLIEEALEREQWSAAQWNKWREEKLMAVLSRAATCVPYYREQWAARRRKGDRSSWDNLENWPILEKESLRRNATAFLADGCDIRKMFHEHTSGTTGKPLELWWSRQTVQAWYALFEARWRRWYGVTKENRWAILGGQLVTPVATRQPPFWVWNLALRQLYMSSYHLAPDLIPYYLDALEKYRIKYIFGYTSALHTLAHEILRIGKKDLQMAVAITNAEPLFEYQRKTISEAFQCPVRETYGMAEIVTAASECDANSLHLWPEVGLTEIVQNSRAVEADTSGDLVCTGLMNTDMPLIRYRVGDRGALAVEGSICACGRGLPMFALLEGRIDDLLYTVDGRRVGRLDPIFKDDLSVREAQIIQERLGRVRLRYVPDRDFSPEKASLMTKRLQDRMGAVAVVLEEVDEIPREHNGKFRAVICQIPDAEINR